jgi:hypothetical protein
MDPLTLDWGAVTPDLSNVNEKIAVHVANHRLGNADDVRRTIRFLCARVRWFQRNLPAGWTQRVFIDDRGQTVSWEVKRKVRVAMERAAEVQFMSEGVA